MRRDDGEQHTSAMVIGELNDGSGELTVVFVLREYCADERTARA